MSAVQINKSKNEKMILYVNDPTDPWINKECVMGIRFIPDGSSGSYYQGKPGKYPGQ